MKLHTLFQRAAFAACIILSQHSAQASDTLKTFDVPAGEASASLRRFSEQSNEQLLYSGETVAGVKTAAVKGMLTSQQALDRMFAGTELAATRDSKTGAFHIAQKRPNGQRAALNSASDRPIRTSAALNAQARTESITGGTTDATASIRGRVSNAATRSFLEGAVVELAGTDNTVITDREGSFHFNGVPTGDVTLIVSFTGLDAQRVPLSVKPGETTMANVELTAEIYRLDKFTVAGEREGTAKAETLQRQAANVKAVISADAFGNVADANIGDFLQRVVGITGDYNGPDVRQVSIRGVGANLNSVTMDGQQLASSQDGSSGRAFEFQQVSLADIETIEVTKAPTPDMHGSSVGGSINLVTKSPFDRAAGRTFNYTLGFATQSGYMGYAPRWKQPIKGFGPSGNFSYSDILGPKKNLGITLSALFHSQPVGGAVSVIGFQPQAEPGPAYVHTVTRTMVKGATRARWATTAKVVYKWSDRTTISFNTAYNFFHANNDTRANSLQASQAVATLDAAGNRTGGGFIHPGFTSDITRVLPGAANTFSNLAVTTNDKTGRTYLFQPMVQHRFDGLQIDYSLSYSNETTHFYSSGEPGTRPKGTVTMRLQNVGWIVDRSGDPVWPSLTQTAGPDIYDLDNYSALLLTHDDRGAVDEVVAGKFDLRKDIPLALPTYIKTGFLLNEQSREVWSEARRYNFAGADGIFGNADDNRGIGQFADVTSEITDDEEKYFQPQGGVPPWPNPYGVARHQSENPTLWREDLAFAMQSRLQNRQFVTEKIGAAYLMGNVRLGKISVLGGVRVEETRVSGEGARNHITPEERARRAAWVGAVTDAEAQRRIEAQFGGRETNKGRYRVVLPGVHLKYEPLRGLVTRLSWSTGIGRPPFGSIIPNTTVNDDTRRVTVGNANLEPQYAHNYDLTAEYYFQPQGMVAVGLFRKKISDYIFSDSSQTVGAGSDNGFGGQYVGYDLTTQANGGFARIEGVEISYQQQLTFLPGWWRGFGVNANYTALRTEGNYGITAAQASTQLAGFVPRTGNVGLSFRGAGFDLRVHANYRSEFLRSNSANAALITYQVAKTTWNWKSRYAISRHLSVFLDVDNIFSEPLDYRFAPYEERIVNFRTYHAKITGGITGRF